MGTKKTLRGIYRVGALLGLGGAVALGAWVLASAVPLPGPGPVTGPVVDSVAAWASDRDGGVVVGLDADLFVVRTARMDWPTELEATGDGGAWVARSVAGAPIGEHRLVRLGAGGEVLADVSLGPVLDLETHDAGDALVLELGSGSAAARVVRVGADGGVATLHAAHGLTAVAGARSVVVIGTATGAVLAFAADGSGPLASVGALAGEVGDLAPGPEPGSWWALDVTSGGTLHLLGADLASVWSVPVGLRALHVVPVPGEERVWLADTTEPAARRFGPGGVLELDRYPLRLSGLDRGVSWHDGGVLLVAPGAVLRLDARGAALPGQGGFDFLVDVDRVPGA